MGQGMKNAKQMISDAAAMNVTATVADGRLRFEGSRGNVKRLFAAQGFDVVAQGRFSFAVYAGTHDPEHFVGTICSDSPAYAYGFTVKA